jgi:hypothetical protein
MSILMLSIAFAGLMGALGWKYKAASWYFAFGFTYIFLLEKATYLNHSYLFCWIAFLMPFIPADRSFSIRVRGNPDDQLTHIPFWPLFLMRFLMGVVYFYGGIAKINPDWMRAVPLKEWMSIRAEKAFIGPIIEQDWVPWLMAYGGLFLDLFAAFLLINKRTRPWIFGFILGFHFVNSLIFNIGIFPTLSITLSALFFPPDFPGRVWNWARRKWRPFLKRTLAYIPKDGLRKSMNIWQALTRYRPIILYSIALLMLIHLLLPFRHHLYPGHVAFTEEGHRYSWRMMLRQKSGSGYFEILDPHSGKKDRIYPYDHINRRQKRKMFTHPDMIWQFAQYIKSEYRDSIPDLEIYARIKVRLNDHSTQVYIDPGVDLGSVQWSLVKRSPWICEQEEPMNWDQTIEDIFSAGK